MDKKKPNKKKFRIYHGKNNFIYIQFQIKDKDGDLVNKTFSRSIKKKSFADAKKELIKQYYDYIGVEPRNPAQKQELRKEILEKIKHGLKGKDIHHCDMWDEIDWEGLFSKPIALLCLASGRSGKTTLMSNVFQKIRDNFSLNTLMSGTINADIYKPFKKCVKLSAINEDYLKLVYTLAKRTKGKRYSFMTYMDDLDMKNKYIDVIGKCFFKWRNYNASTWLNAQDMVMVQKSVRNCGHLVLFMNTRRMDNSRLDYIFEVLQPYFMDELGCLPKSQQKNAIIKFCHEMTNNYGFILVDTLENKIHICKNKLKN